MRPVLLLLLLTSFALPGPAAADTYTLERSAVSATGGSVSGGPFRLNFTIGQSAVGAQSGAATKLASGFWWEMSGSPVSVGGEPPPSGFTLGPSAPNPFATRTLVRYGIPAGNPAPVFVGIYDVRGALIKTLVDETRPPGTHSVGWDGRGESGEAVRAGVYFIRFEGPGFRQHRRVAVLR